jgi:hypothetical protein
VLELLLKIPRERPDGRPTDTLDRVPVRVIRRNGAGIGVMFTYFDRLPFRELERLV